MAGDALVNARQLRERLMSHLDKVPAVRAELVRVDAFISAYELVAAGEPVPPMFGAAPRAHDRSKAIKGRIMSLLTEQPMKMRAILETLEASGPSVSFSSNPENYVTTILWRACKAGKIMKRADGFYERKKGESDGHPEA